ncbi:AAA family ATPase [Virgibacillus dakarensis]|nr:AAA family ATPase [Virgibacillus dakarensis]
MRTYPFTAIVGQTKMKQALILNGINPKLGGVLIQGEKGTAKSTAVRALADVLTGTKVVNLPISATEDRLVGTLNMEHMLKIGEKKLEPGILAKADGNILYVDEVNLLEDHLVDVLLDAAAMGINRIERDGISYEHPARFMLVGTMNPEEGELRPQLLVCFKLPHIKSEED